MDNKKNTLLKDTLAVVGAVAVVKFSPVLALGVTLGALITNPDKVEKALKDVAEKCQDFPDLDLDFDLGDLEDMEIFKTGMSNKSGNEEENKTE